MVFLCPLCSSPSHLCPGRAPRCSRERDLLLMLMKAAYAELLALRRANPSAARARESELMVATASLVTKASSTKAIDMRLRMASPSELADLAIFTASLMSPLPRLLTTCATSTISFLLNQEPL